jgi:CHAD domain-containing protein
VAQSTKVLPAAMREQGRDRCAWLGAIPGPPRDHVVQLLEWDRSVAGLEPDTIAALAPVRVVLQQRCDAAHAALADALRSPDAVAFLATWRRWLADPASAGEPGPRADTPLARYVTRRIARAQDRLLEHGRAVDDATPPALVHELRKDGKKLRYLLECFAGVLADGPRKAFVSRLKALQENLGAFQDADVHMAELRDISAELYRRETPSETMVAVLRMLERLHAARAAARAEFGERFRVYDTAETADAFEAMLGRSRH